MPGSSWSPRCAPAATVAAAYFAYTLAALIVAAPWYIDHAAQISSTYSVIGGLTPNPEQAPPLSSLSSFTWYGWNLVNEQLFAPLTVAFVIGIVLALRRLIRRGLDAASVEPELLAGAFVSYLGMTVLVHKDPRYTLPMLVYVALLATGWIATLSRARWRAALSAAVVALAAIYFVESRPASAARSSSGYPGQSTRSRSMTLRAGCAAHRPTTGTSAR